MAQPDKKAIAEAEKRAMSPADVKEDMMLVLGPHMNWQEMLNPAPLSICLLGQLVLATLEKDVCLVSDAMDRSAFQYIKHPESLRTSMVQVANRGWTAFNCANKNMDQIRLLTLQVPQHVKNAVKFIIGGSNEEIEELVPDILSNIDRIANTCTEKAEEVESMFTDVMDLIGELQEACTLAKGQYDEKLKKAKAEKEVKTKRKEDAEARKQRANEEYMDMKTQIEKSRKCYEKALESMPSAGSMVVTSFFERLGKSITGSVGAVTSAATLKSLRKRSPQNGPSEEILIGEMERISVYVQQLLGLKQRFLDGKDNGDLLITPVEAGFNDIVDALKVYNGAARSRVTEITTDCLNLIRLLKQYSRQMASRNTDQEQTVNNIANRIEAKVEGLEVFCNQSFGRPPMQTPTPKMTSVEQTSSESVANTYSQQCRFKVEQAGMALEAARADFKESSRKVEEASETVATLIAELARINLDEVDFMKIKELLQRGIKALGEVKTQWGKLVRFFQTMSNIIKCCMNENVKNFVQSAEKGKKFQLKYSLSDLLRDMIFTQASEANKIAFMVNNLAGMYVEVSEKHLMDQVASLGQLLAFDPEKEKHLISKQQMDLRNQAEEATSSIADIVRQKQIEFDTRITKRIEKIETEMRAVLPPAKLVDPEIEMERKKAIKEAEEYKEAAREQDVDDWV